MHIDRWAVLWADRPMLWVEGVTVRGVTERDRTDITLNDPSNNPADLARTRPMPIQPIPDRFEPQ